MAKKTSNNPNGRNVIEIEWEKAEAMCRILCTGEEISSILGVNYSTLERAIKREKKMCFADWYKKESSGGKASLRRSQFKAAIENLNPTMLIWLGKQHLGQTEPKDRVDEIDDTNEPDEAFL